MRTFHRMLLAQHRTQLRLALRQSTIDADGLGLLVFTRSLIALDHHRHHREQQQHQSRGREIDLLLQKRRHIDHAFDAVKHRGIAGQKHEIPKKHRIGNQEGDKIKNSDLGSEQTALGQHPQQGAKAIGQQKTDAEHADHAGDSIVEGETHG